MARITAHDAVATEYADQRRERRSISPLLVTYDPVPALVIDAIIFDLDNCLPAADEVGAVLLDLRTPLDEPSRIDVRYRVVRAKARNPPG